jgi:thioredoxin 1
MKFQRNIIVITVIFTISAVTLYFAKGGISLWLKNTLTQTKQVEPNGIKEISDVELLKNKEKFENYIKGINKNVIVKFTASWCPACKLMIPIEKELSQSFDKKITFVKINIENTQVLTQAYGIGGIPLYIYFKDGKEVERKVGGSNKVSFEKEIKRVFEIK